MTETLVAALVAGALIGPLARAALPGRHDTGVTASVVLGAFGSVVGAWIYKAASGSQTSGVDWTSFLIGAVVAAALIVGYGMIASDSRHR
jgi:uncharacterized membrane protein YeaQ/YmgE (transglycosylase-associated protein family)